MSRSFTDNINSFNVSGVANVLNVSNNYTVAEDRSEILTWLSPLEPRIRHQDLRTCRADSVGEWLLRTEEFQRWCDSSQQVGSENATLFCYGSPAVGKTYFSSLVVDMLCDRAREQNVAVACFYVDFAAREEQSPTNMLGSLLKQIVGGLDRIPDEMGRTFQDHKKVIGGRGLRVPEIVKMLQDVTSLRPTFMCIDTVDECVDRHRPEVLDSLRQILEKSPNTQISLTGRRHIRGEIEKHLGTRAATLFIKPNDDDIGGYIRMRSSKDTALEAMDSSLEGEIIKSIAENIPETFLLISLTMDAILGETTAYDRRQKLRAMMEGLDLEDVYGATLARIKEQGGQKARLGMAALMWISHSERLLQLDELSHALAVEIGSRDLNPEKVPSVEALLSYCLGLIVIDRQVSAIRLIHFTLQEYLYTCPDLFGPTHSIMGETCLTYLNFQTIKDTSSMLFAPPLPTPFLQYSSLYWGIHARREASLGVVSLALKLFRQIESHVSTKLLLVDLISRTGRYSSNIPIDGTLIGFTGLHCASVFGIAEIAKPLVDRPNSDLNKRDFLGITLLIWAAICGQEGVANLLLERQAIDPDEPDIFFRRTALSWAAEKGREGVVKLLLGRASAKPDGTASWLGKTSQVINMVLGRRHVNPNKLDKYGQTLILLAAAEGHEGVVQLLLERRDVKADAADGYGCTPLLRASGKGHEGVVRLLLEREEVSVDRADKSGQTPLLAAAEDGSLEVVGLLLGRKDINPNTRGKVGQTPLSLAAGYGYDGAVKLLLGREDVNPDIPDNNGRTPLSCAAAGGRDGAVQLLLGRKDVNPDMPDNNGRTPLLYAAVGGYDEVVNLSVPNGPGGLGFSKAGPGLLQFLQI